MGRWLRAAGYIPDRVVCSTARRAAQTWQLAQPALGSAPPAVFDDRVYDSAAAQLLDVQAAAQQVPAARAVAPLGRPGGLLRGYGGVPRGNRAAARRLAVHQDRQPAFP